METFLILTDFITTCLKKWNYPQIHGMDSSQIGDIFSASNRSFLVAWLLKRLYPEQFLENQHYDSEKLQDFLTESGFCTSRQKSKMFCVEFYEDQVEVLYRMFVFAEKLSESIESTNTSKITTKEIEDISKLDVNLFPCYGRLRVLTAEQRETLRGRLKHELELADSELHCVENLSHGSIGLSDFEEEVSKLITDIKTHLPEFSSITYELSKESDATINDKLIFKKDINSITQRSAANIRKISQYLTDIRTIADFTTNNDDMIEHDISENREAFKIIKLLAEQTQDIAKTIVLLNTKSKMDK